MSLGMNMLSLSRPLVMLMILLPYILGAPSQSLLALYVISAAFFVASSAVIVQWITAPCSWQSNLIWAEIGLVALINALSAGHNPGGPAASLFFPVYITLFLVMDRSLWRAAVALTTIAWLGSTLLPRSPDLTLSVSMVEIAMNGLLFLFSSSVGLLVRSLQDEQARSEGLLAEVTQSRGALERTHRQLVESASRQQEMAVLEERQRLAREIHDSVAHSLTALVVQIQVARRLAERAPTASIQTLTNCEAMARLALTETRQALRALHPAGLEQQADVEALLRLGRDYGIATDTTVTVTADEASRQLPANSVRLEHLYRIFQEALTNAHRHGQARRVTADLSVRDQTLYLTITNDGLPPQHLEPGIGLRSMRERAEALGGALQVEAAENGLTLCVSVPIKQEAVS